MKKRIATFRVCQTQEDAMRVKVDSQRYFNWTPSSNAKIVLAYEEKYNGVSRILDENPAILDAIDKDLRKLSRPGKAGRRATFTSENLLRALIVYQVEGASYRETAIRLTHSLFLQDFCRFGSRGVPNFTLIEKAFKSIRPATWTMVNDTLTRHAFDKGKLDPSKVRTDTTVVDANIHYPTDSNLLWDSWRVLYRLLSEGRDLLASRGAELFENRFHDRKVKKLHIFITRYTSSPSAKRQREVQKRRKKYLAQLERIVRCAEDFVALSADVADLRIWALGAQIGDNLKKVRKVLRAATRAWLKGEVVPASERIFSIFEDHVELIKRGRRHKPVEFGHAVLLTQTKEKFITQYDVMEEKIPDSKLSDRVVEKHKSLFGAPPEELAGDKGFWGGKEAMDRLRDKVKTVGIPHRLKDFADEVMVGLQKFRAGIEGSISVLKRAFGLSRCRFRGFKSFDSFVGLGVLCHNLVLLAGGT